MDALNGYKTFIIAGILILAAVLATFGWIPSNVFQAIMGLLLGAGMVTTRLAIGGSK